MELARIIKLEKMFAEHVENIYNNAARFHWNSEFLNNAINEKIWTNPEFAKLPRYAKSFVEGVRWHLDRQHWKLLEFSYCVNGVRMRLSENRYRKIPAQEINAKWSHTGAFVYRDKPEALFTEPGPR